MRRVGGSAVSDAEFRARLPPLDGPITAYAHLLRAGERPQARAVGLLRPDRLGLHDMTGNVEEYVLDPYRLARGGRSGGRVGGVVARGGDAATPPDRARSSYRIEYPPFREDGSPLTRSLLGFRLALGLPVVPDIAAGGALRRAWEEETSRAMLPDPADDPRALIQRLG